MRDSEIAANIAKVQQRINNAGKSYSSAVQLIAVSKTRPAEDLLSAHQSGLRHFGENYLQEALEKMQKLHNLHLVWHFIGHIQSNKTADIAKHFDWVQTLDRAKIAERLNNQRPTNKMPLNVLIQVNIDNEESKSGANAEEVAGLAKVITELPQLRLRGLMSIPAVLNTTNHQLNSHQRMRQLYIELQKQFPTVDTLSMGMSGDLETAISASSNMVRIGTDIFGGRQF